MTSDMDDKLATPCKKGNMSLNIGAIMRRIEDSLSKDYSNMDDAVPRKPRWFRRAVLASVFATAAGVVALYVITQSLLVQSTNIYSVWLAVVLALITRLRPYKTANGLESIVEEWQAPSDSMRLLSPWSVDFSQDIVPKPCHSHNDYWRRVPLFDALAAGCTSVEADIWLPDQQSTSTELRVGHTNSSLTTERTLSSLYIEPLAAIMSNMATSMNPKSGIFETDSSQTLTLLLDFKSEGAELWPYVEAQLEPLRNHGWLRYWDGLSKKIVPGPITIVGTGNAPFDLIIANNTYRDVFYDAPLDDLDSNRFNSSNSYFASAALGQAVGQPILGHFNAQSMTKLTSQIANAEARGLLSRYWDTPAWPVSARDRVWNALVENGVGMLNVDALDSAARWNWDWCVVAGLSLCGW